MFYFFYLISPRLRLSRHRTALCVYIQSHHRHLLYSIFSSLSYFIHYGMNNILAVSQRSVLFSRTMKYIAFTWIVWTCLSSDMCGWTLHGERSPLHRAQSFPSLIKKICVIYSLFHSEVMHTRLKWEWAQLERTKFTELYKSSPANKPCVCRFLTQWTANNTANECDDKNNRENQNQRKRPTFNKQHHLRVWHFSIGISLICVISENFSFFFCCFQYCSHMCVRHTWYSAAIEWNFMKKKKTMMKEEIWRKHTEWSERATNINEKWFTAIFYELPFLEESAWPELMLTCRTIHNSSRII